MKLRKLTATLLAGAMALSLAACGSSPEEAASTEPTAEQVAEETEAEATGALAVLGFFSNALQIALIIRQSKTIHKRPMKTVPTPIPTMNKFDTKTHLL